MNELNSHLNTGIADPIVGTNWNTADLTKLRAIRNDNADISQRAFATLVQADFPGRTYQGVYHQVRYVDLMTRLTGAPVAAVEII